MHLSLTAEVKSRVKSFEFPLIAGPSASARLVAQARQRSGPASAAGDRAADDAWLQDEAARAGVPIREARLALATLDAAFARHQVGEGALLAAETIVAVIREFAVAVAPDEDPGAVRGRGDEVFGARRAARGRYGPRTTPPPAERQGSSTCIRTARPSRVVTPQ